MGLEHIAVALLIAGSGTAKTVDLSRMPSEYVGQRVVLTGIACVEEIHSGYVCIAPAGGSLIAIDAAILDADDAADLDTNQFIHDECLGTANLDRTECIFDAAFTPKTFRVETASTAGGSRQLVRFYAGTMKLTRSRP